MCRLIGITIIKNEEKNYLKPWLENISKFLDYHVFLDDASNDNTCEIIENKIKKGYKAEIHKRDISIFKDNEPELRSELWEYTRKIAKNGDWILIVDADEFYDERLLYFKRKLFTKQFQKYECATVAILDMWDKNNYRIDGMWSPKHSDIRLVKYKDVEFTQSSKALHQDPFPNSINIEKNYKKTFIPKVHLAYLRETDRKRRYEFYKENVTDKKLRKHALSIYDEKPTLKPYLSKFDNFKRLFCKNKIDIFENI